MWTNGPMLKTNGFKLLCASLLALMLGLSFDYGMTWDEPVHMIYGRLVFDYYTSGFKDLSSFYFFNLYLYGAFFDLLTGVVHRLLPWLAEFEARHLLNAFFGWSGMIFASLLARRLFGRAEAILTLLFLAASPHFFGHSMNNHKDIPFMTLYMASLYALSFVRPKFPFFTLRSALAVVTTIALTINVRAGGMILIGYAGLLILLLLLREENRSLPRWAITSGVFAAMALVTILLGILFWPWALWKPLIHPFIALEKISKFSWGGATLFNGAWIGARDVPWYYIPKWLAVTTPLPLLAAFLISPVLIFKHESRTSCAALFFVIFFPWLYAVIGGSTLYDGFRHFLFIYPPIVILTSAALVTLYQWTSQKIIVSERIKIITGSFLLMIGLADPLLFSIRNHPHQTTYFNALTGGASGAFLKWEMDYWANCFRAALDWVDQEAKLAGKNLVYTTSEPRPVARVYDSFYERLEFVEEGVPYDYKVELMRGPPSDLLLKLQSDKIVYSVSVDGAPLCLVKKGSRP